MTAEKTLPVPAVGDDVDVASGLRVAQLDAAARRAMTDAKMTRERGDAGLAKGDIIISEPREGRRNRGRRITNRARDDAGTRGEPRPDPNPNPNNPPGSSPGGSVGSIRKRQRAQGHRGGRRRAVQALPQGQLRRRPSVAQAPRAVRRRQGQVWQHAAPRRVPKRSRAAGEDVRPLRRRRQRCQRKKNTALHFAVQYGFDALGDFLVEKGASRDARNDEGRTPYEGL